MEKIKVLVVEDEVIIADDICRNLKELGYLVTEPAISFTEAISTLDKEKPDVALLDIQLSGKKTGIDVAQEINENYNIPFIFLTANSDVDTVSKAKEVKPNAYLVKPFSKDELYTSIEIAIHNFMNSDQKEVKEKSIFIKEKGFYTKINFEDIVYIRSAHVYIEIFLKSKQKVVLRTSLTEIIKKLDSNFVRIHRGYIINLQHIKQLNQNTVQLSDIELPMGSKYKELILERINLI